MVNIHLFAGDLLYPVNINSLMCNRADVRKFAIEAKKIGVQYIGLCCGNAPNLLREVAEVYDRTPEASKYSPDISENILMGKRGANINKDIEKVRRFSLGDTLAAATSLYWTFKNGFKILKWKNKSEQYLLR